MCCCYCGDDMKIIKRGEKPEDKPIHMTCYRCNTEIEVPRGECSIKDERLETIASYPCPVCENPIYTKIS